MFKVREKLVKLRDCILEAIDAIDEMEQAQSLPHLESASEPPRDDMPELPSPSVITPVNFSTPKKIVKDISYESEKDLDETFFEAAEEATSPVFKIRRSGRRSLRREYTSPGKGHVCELPRCRLHQPFQANKREYAALSPSSKKLCNKQRVVSPKGYWARIPSTQVMLARQLQESEEEIIE